MRYKMFVIRFTKRRLKLLSATVDTTYNIYIYLEENIEEIRM